MLNEEDPWAGLRILAAAVVADQRFANVAEERPRELAEFVVARGPIPEERLQERGSEEHRRGQEQLVHLQEIEEQQIILHESEPRITLSFQNSTELRELLAHQLPIPVEHIPPQEEQRQQEQLVIHQQGIEEILGVRPARNFPYPRTSYSCLSQEI